MTKIIGLKVAQPGKNVEQASDVELSFSTLFNTLPVYRVISLAYALSASDSTRRTVKHGLPFVPYHLIFWKGSSNAGKWQLYPTSGAGVLTSEQSILLERVDKENISFITNSSIGVTSTINVIIVVFAFPIALSL
jgi:hypothetical protein